MNDELNIDLPPTDPTPAAPPDPAQRLQEVERLLAEERGRREALEGTLKVLRPAEAPRQTTDDTVMAGGGMRLPRQAVHQIAQETGWSEEDVLKYAPVMNSFFSVLAGPTLQAMANMADHLDLVGTRQEIPDYETIAEATDRVRQEHIAQGRFISRKQAAALVKAERAADPKTLEDRVQAEVQRRLSEGDRRAAASAAVTEGATGPGSQSAGPTASKLGSRPLTKSEFARLPLDKQRELLADLPL